MLQKTVQTTLRTALIKHLKATCVRSIHAYRGMLKGISKVDVS